ncbi:hypothetical protein Ocin01_13857, partial [Orchesella cincta]
FTLNFSNGFVGWHEAPQIQIELALLGSEQVSFGNYHHDFARKGSGVKEINVAVETNSQNERGSRSRSSSLNEELEDVDASLAVMTRLLIAAMHSSDLANRSALTQVPT